MKNNDNWYNFNSQNFSESSGMYTTMNGNNSCSKSLMGGYSMKKISDHLYTIDFDDINENIGRTYALQHYDKFACSSVRKGNFYGRNFDWYYDHMVEFVVRIGASENRYASIGVSGFINSLTDDVVPKFKYIKDYEAIPYLMLDGINEKGVVANINVVPAGEMGSGKITTGTNPGKKRIPQNYIIRYILDNYATAKDAVEGIKNDLDIYAPQLPGFHYEIHCMIGDKDNNYIVEFIDNEIKVIEGDRANIMTNFYITGTEITDENKVDWKTLTKYGSGYERYNLAMSAYNTIESIDDMKSLMRNTIKYSNAYTKEEGDDFWYTEFVGDYGDYQITVEDCINRVTKFHDVIIPTIKERYANKNRDDKNVWISCHSTVYDIENKIMWVTAQEGDEVNDLGFGFNKDYDYSINLK